MIRILHAAEFFYSPDQDRILIDYGVIVNAEGWIIQTGSISSLRNEADEQHDHQILMPSLVNAHIHLTDAHRRQPVPGGEGLVQWVRGLLSDRDGGLRSEERRRIVEDTLCQLYRLGTGGIGEVANNDGTYQVIAESRMPCRLIHELIAFRSDRASGAIEEAHRVRQIVDDPDAPRSVLYAMGAHAPYSVSPNLMQEIARESFRLGQPFYQHLAEDPQERLLYSLGEGEWADFLKEIGAWDLDFQPPGLPPIPFYDKLGILNERFVAVHLADATPEEIRLLASRGVRAILSPRSNLHITGLLPDLPTMISAGMRIAFGTDGRGSNPSLDLLDEARLLSSTYPDLPPGALLYALTSGGADILELPALGSIIPDAKPGLLAFEIVDQRTDLSSIQGFEQGVLFGEVNRKRVA